MFVMFDEVNCLLTKGRPRDSPVISWVLLGEFIQSLFSPAQGLRKFQTVGKNKIFYPKLSDKRRVILRHFAKMLNISKLTFPISVKVTTKVACTFKYSAKPNAKHISL